MAVFIKQSIPQQIQIGQQDQRKCLIQHSLEQILLKSVPTP